jgi:molybdate transport system substrate-binding protein
MSRIVAVVVVMASSLVLAAGCGRGPAPTPAGPLRVAAASDLQPALADLEAGFRRATGRAVQLVAGSSGQFAQQIRQGAPFDVLLSADREYVRALERDGIVVAGSPKAYALGTLVLAARAESAATVATLEDLAKPEVRRVAMANPDHAPYGRAAKQALVEAGLWEALRAKVVLADSVRQAAQFVETGNADAGLLGRSVAEAAGLAGRPVPPRLYDPIVQGLGVVAASRHREAAQAFVDFLVGPEGQDILRSHGFAPPRPGGGPVPKDDAPATREAAVL